MKTYHILPHSHRGWCILASGSKRVSAFANTRRMAEKIGNRFLKNGLAKIVIIHGNNGEVIDYFPRKELI